MSGIRMSLTTQSGRMAATCAQGRGPGREGVRLELGRPEGPLEEQADLRVVVDHDHSAGGLSFLGSRTRCTGRHLSDPGSGCQRRLDRAYDERRCSSSPGTERAPATRRSGSRSSGRSSPPSSARTASSSRRCEQGWRFSLEWREDPSVQADELIANTPESVAYNIYVNLAGGGKPIDPTGGPGAARAASSSARRTTEPPRRGNTNETAGR